MTQPISYKDSGVDIDAGNESVHRIKPLVKATHNATVLAGIGSFGGIIDLGAIIKGYKHPVLVQSIDSVGTKLMVATMAGKHDTIGIDMVAHSCNDILCQGARPISFLDYIAVNKLRPGQVEEILTGISVGCREVGLPVIGGEIAELPGVYSGEEYDLVGAVTGIVEREKIVDGARIRAGDVLIGLKSSGLHTNGYSLARKVFFDAGGYSLKDTPEGMEETLGAALLKPHRNYTNQVLSLMEKVEVRGIAHITGGGLTENIPRILPEGAGVVIHKGAWTIPPLFQTIGRIGKVPKEDLYRTLNMGIGLVLVVKKDESEKALECLKTSGEEPMIVGEVRESAVRNVVYL